MNRIFKNMRTAIFALCCTVVASCNDSVSVDAIYITAAEKTPVTSFSAKHAGDAMGITISSALIPSEDIEGTLSIDNALVENYNRDRKSTRLNSSHANISYAVFCLKKKKIYTL